MMFRIYCSILLTLLVSHQTNSENLDLSDEYFGFAPVCFVESYKLSYLLSPARRLDGVETELECMELCLHDENCVLGYHRDDEMKCVLFNEYSDIPDGTPAWEMELFQRSDKCVGLFEKEGCLLFSLDGYIFGRPAYKSIPDVRSYADCTNLCLNQSQCLSGMYYHAEERCLLNTQSASTDPDLFKRRAAWNLAPFRNAIVTYFQKKVQCHNESEALQIDQECFKVTSEPLEVIETSVNESGSEQKRYSDCTNNCLSEKECGRGTYNPKEEKCETRRWYGNTGNVQNGSIGFEKIIDCFTDGYAVRTSECFDRTDNITAKYGIRNKYDLEKTKTYLDCTNRCLADDRCLSGIYDFRSTYCYMMTDSATTLADRPGAFYVKDDTILHEETYFEKHDDCFQHACSDRMYGYILDIPSYKEKKAYEYWKCTQSCTKDNQCLSAVYYPADRLCLFYNESASTQPDVFIKNSSVVVMYFEKTEECIQTYQQERDQCRAKEETPMGECFESMELNNNWSYKFQEYSIDCYFDCTNFCLMDRNCYWGVFIEEGDVYKCLLNNERYTIDYKLSGSRMFRTMQRFNPEVAIRHFKKKDECVENVQVIRDCFINETDDYNTTIGRKYTTYPPYITTDLECITICLNQIQCIAAIYSYERQKCQFLVSLSSDEVYNDHSKTANNTRYFEKKEECYDVQFIKDDDCFQRADGYYLVVSMPESESWTKSYTDCKNLCFTDPECVSGEYLGASLYANCILNSGKSRRDRYRQESRLKHSIYFEKTEECTGQDEGGMNPTSSAYDNKTTQNEPEDNVELSEEENVQEGMILQNTTMKMDSGAHTITEVEENAMGSGAMVQFSTGVIAMLTLLCGFW